MTLAYRYLSLRQFTTVINIRYRDQPTVQPNSRGATALRMRAYCALRRTTEIEGDQRTRGKEIWRKKWAQQVSSTAGGMEAPRQQHKTELIDADKYSLLPLLHMERQA